MRRFLPALLALAVLSGCSFINDFDSLPVPGAADAGATAGDTGLPPETADTGAPVGTDAGPEGTDGGTGEPDGGPADDAGGPTNLDAGPSSLDAGPVATPALHPSWTSAYVGESVTFRVTDCPGPSLSTLCSNVVVTDWSARVTGASPSQCAISATCLNGKTASATLVAFEPVPARVFSTTVHGGVPDGWVHVTLSQRGRSWRTAYRASGALTGVMLHGDFDPAAPGELVAFQDAAGLPRPVVTDPFGHASVPAPIIDATVSVQLAAFSPGATAEEPSAVVASGAADVVSAVSFRPWVVPSSTSPEVTVEKACSYTLRFVPHGESTSTEVSILPYSPFVLIRNAAASGLELTAQSCFAGPERQTVAVSPAPSVAAPLPLQISLKLAPTITRGSVYLLARRGVASGERVFVAYAGEAIGGELTSTVIVDGAGDYWIGAIVDVDGDGTLGPKDVASLGPMGGMELLTVSGGMSHTHQVSDARAVAAAREVLEYDAGTLQSRWLEIGARFNQAVPVKVRAWSPSVAPFDLDLDDGDAATFRGLARHDTAQPPFYLDLTYPDASRTSMEIAKLAPAPDPASPVLCVVQTAPGEVELTISDAANFFPALYRFVFEDASGNRHCEVETSSPIAHCPAGSWVDTARGFIEKSIPVAGGGVSGVSRVRFDIGSPPVCGAGAEVCDNRIDDDGDQSADCRDTDCLGKTCAGGGTCDASGNCGGGETGCWGGADEDFDGKTDCGDPDCFDKRCSNAVTPTACTAAGTCEQLPPESTCNDTLDNDRDGAADCADSDCSGKSCASSAPLKVCVAFSTCDYAETACDDGEDNDGNGSTDCADPTCRDRPCNSGNPAAVCNDSLDCE